MTKLVDNTPYCDIRVQVEGTDIICHLGETGPKGEDGMNGADGYTPVRGKDYWNDADINMIKNYCDSILDKNSEQFQELNEQIQQLLNEIEDVTKEDVENLFS